MCEQGFDVHVVSSAGGLLDDFGKQEGVRIHTVNMTRRITPFADFIALIRLCSLIRRIKPTIVHAHSPKGGLLGMLAAWLCRIPIRIYHVRGFPFMTASGLKRRLLVAAEKISCNLAHRVLCVSESMKRVAFDSAVCVESKSKVLLNGSGNGVDAEVKFNPSVFDNEVTEGIRKKLGIPSGQIVIGFVGRIVKDKGICELVDAWKIIRAKFPNVCLLVVGPFEDEDPIPQQTKLYLENDKRVYITGFVQSEELPAMFAAMDIFTLPSHREGFPVVLLEAGAMKLPVVASDIPGCSDAVVDNETGTLFRLNNTYELIEKLELYIQNEEVRKSHGSKSRELILANYRRENIWNAILVEYRELLSMIKC